MVNLLELFSTDRRLLDHRGSLIIRQLCLHLNTERIYRTLAEILEKEEDLEFASVMIQKLNLILITSPELAEFRRRLKTLETRVRDFHNFFESFVDGCFAAGRAGAFHDSVPILVPQCCGSLLAMSSSSSVRTCFEPALNIVGWKFSLVIMADDVTSADLEISVQLLVQVDKLVQLIESPVFTCAIFLLASWFVIMAQSAVSDLRLQLLEPERYPYLFKCLYGLLMLLPQSNAFLSLRNRLNAVNSAGFLHIAPKS